jgi:pyridoxamine 5'-phosphate oxidase family protein
LSFTDEEIAYMGSQPLARLATVAGDGQPDVVPVAFELDAGGFWVGGVGAAVLGTRKFRNLRSGNRKVSLVIDDLVSLNPFVARGIRIDGRAGDPVERVGMVGPGTFFLITPVVSWSWNLAGEPAGETWYPTHRRVHSGATDA